jgi:hypothetical protein
MKINQIQLGFKNVALEEKARLIGIRDTYEYQDGKLTDKKIGVTYVLLLEKQNFEKLTVKCNDINPIMTQEELDKASEPLYIGFVGFVGGFYYSNRTNTWEITCKADKAVINKK